MLRYQDGNLNDTRVSTRSRADGSNASLEHQSQMNTHTQQYGTLTAQYPFDALTVGNYFTVYARFQHARVAASEYGRKHGMVFSCRMQPDRTMRVYRVASDQARVDQRGRHGKRRIESTTVEPTQVQFNEWLDTFEHGQSYSMPTSYRASYLLMTAWVSLYALQHGEAWKCGTSGKGELLITRL